MPSHLAGLPESGRMVLPPSSRSICQRSSFHWVLSTLSPVVIAKSSARPVTGPPARPLIDRTIASATCAVSISHGRDADENGTVDAAARLGPLHRPRNSPLAG